ncbi:MAG: FAD binding domain-containing protein [Proteobacteria bacterium]|nr:FAD binding domain-containing protein [Pseudomonadota bacterium]
MKPSAFKYVRAGSVEHACALLAEHGEDARLLAGGQSLVAMMNLRLARPSVLIDIGRLALADIAIGTGSVRLGALTRHRMLIEHLGLRRMAPVFGETARYIAHPTIRNHGTAGGSVAHADPTAEIPGLLVLLDGHVDAASQGSVRQIQGRELFRGAFSTSLKPQEMISALHFRIPAGRWGGNFLELAERVGDFALAAVGAVVERDGEQVTGARIVLLGAESVPVRASAAEASLVGERLTESVAAQAGAAAAAAQRCYGDVRASAGYRRHLLSELTRRALLTAYARAGAAA